MFVIEPRLEGNVPKNTGFTYHKVCVSKYHDCESGGYVITGIGSFPFVDVDKALDLIFSTCSEVPFWPQMPKRSPLENMYSTFLEGVPSLVRDKNRNTVFIDTDNVDGVEQFYNNVENNAFEKFSISDEAAPGFFRFLERLKGIEGIRFIKCQLMGPFSMGIGLKDQNNSSIIFNDAFYDIIRNTIRMKAQWMINCIKNVCPGKEIIIFFDEPYMVSFGSAYVSVSKEQAISTFNEVTQGLDARTGVHVCANTDWSVLLNSNFDIINYDAYNFLDTLFYYPEDLSRFLARGGWIAPGIVPSVQEGLIDANINNLRELVSQFKSKMEVTTGPSATKGELLMTTSCGLGGLSTDEARKAMHLLSELDHT